MYRTKLIKPLLVLMLIASIPLSTGAYALWGWGGVSWVKWSSNLEPMFAAAVSFPSGNPYRTALNDCIGSINTYNPSPFRFQLIFDDSSVGRGNGQNEIWFSSDNAALAGAPAITYAWRDGHALVETDIIFDNREAYTSGKSKSTLWEYGGPYRPFRNTALHELGHATGLAHVASLYNIMGTDWTYVNVNGPQIIPYLGEDASNGLVALYGMETTLSEDVSVTHWRHYGHSGEYSTHARTRIFNANGNELSRVSGQDEPRYYVDNGQRIQVEFTYENNGASTHEFEVEYYLSTNDIILGTDRFLGSAYFTLSRDVPYTSIATLDLPSDLQINSNYHIGVILNTNYAFPEISYDNNASYIGVRTTNYQVPTPVPTPTPTQRIIVRPTIPDILRPTATPTERIIVRPTIPDIIFPTATPRRVVIIPVKTFIIPELILKNTPTPFPEFKQPVSVATFIRPFDFTPVIPQPTPTPSPLAITRPQAMKVYRFNEANLAEAGLTEVPGGFSPGFAAGSSLIGSVPSSDESSTSDGRGLRLQCQPGQVMLVLAHPPIPVGKDPVIIRLNAQASSPQGQFALVVLDGSMDGSLATSIPSRTDFLMEDYKRISLIYEPTTTETLTFAVQLFTPSSASGDVEIYVDNIEIIPFAPGTAIDPSFVRQDLK